MSLALLTTKGGKFNSQVGTLLSYCVLMPVCVNRRRTFEFETVSKEGIEKARSEVKQLRKVRVIS